MSEELFQKMFNEMARQSERQLGAFMMLYAVEFDEAHKLDKQIVEFRNGVIHKGVIPDLDEAKKFCSAVYEIIAGLYEKLSGKYSEHIRKLVSHEVGEKRKKVSRDMATVTSTGTMFFNISRADNPRSFADALDSFRKAQAAISGAIPYMQRMHEMISALKN